MSSARGCPIWRRLARSTAHRIGGLVPRVLLIAVLFLAACWPAIPRNPIVEWPPHVLDAIDVYQQYYSESLGLDLPPFEGGIIWMEGERLELEGQFWDDWMIAGADGEYGIIGLYMPDHQAMYLLVRESLVDTALSHELIHYWLDVTTGSIDAYHKKSEWWSLEGGADDAIMEIESGGGDE